MEQHSSTSAFLWQAAISTANTHPLIAANILLRCKQALKETNVGINSKKINKTSMCQSCGNPWNRGDYHLKIKKKFKTSRINKLQKKKASPKANLNKFDQHVLQEYEKSKSYLIIQCSYCRKDSEISIGLPAKEGKVYQDTTHGVQLKKKSDKTKEEGKSLGQLAMVSKGHPIIKPVKNKHICPPKGNKKAGMGTVASKKTAQLSKKQLKTIAQGIASQKKSSPSALTAFLNKL